MELDRRQYLVLLALLFVLAAIYWWWSGYEPAGTVMLAVFGIAVALLGLILIPTVPTVGHAAPIVPLEEPQPSPGDEIPADQDTSDRPALSGPIEIEIRIQRYNPETDDEPHWEHYIVNADPSDRVLDLLHQVKWQIDGTLTFRRSCAHGICGSDAMMINGRNRLTCEYLVKDAGTFVSIEPIRGIPVVKDLLVDMDPFWEKYKSVMPFLVNDDIPADGKERRQSPQDRERYDDTTKCIACAACTTACPSFWANEKFVGPAAIVNAHRFIFDSRDHGSDERLQILADADGVWRCRTIFNCVEACPRGINITGAILEVTQEIQQQRIS